MAKDKPATKADKATEVDYTVYAAKAATEMQARFADWVIAKVGLEFGTGKEEKAFREGVRIGTALRIPFQASDENQSARQAKASVPKAEAAPKAAKAAKAAKGKPAEAEEAVVAEAVAATKPKAKPAKKAVPSKAAPF